MEDVEKKVPSDDLSDGYGSPKTGAGNDHTHIHILQPGDEARVRRKIDMVVLPMMCLVFFTQYLDKQSLSYASIYGLLPDLDLSSSQYSWLTSCFYLSQLVSEWPFIYLMSRLPIAKFVGGTIIVWGAICMCLAAPHSFAGFATVRCFLGFAEGAVSPAFITITSIWYKKSEHPMRVGMWHEERLAIAAWRVMFLVAGSITVFAGVLFYVAMPAGPGNAWFLTAEEKLIAEKRLASQHDGGDKTTFSVPQLKESATDIQAPFAFMFGLLVTMCSPVLTFASLVIRNLGYSSSDTLLYGSPSGAVQIAFIWLGVAACWIWPDRRNLIVMAISIVPLVGCVLLTVLPLSSGWGMIVASWLASVISSQFSILMSLSASNVRGNTKKAVVNALFFVGYCTGCIAAPQLWTDPPRYRKGVICALVDWGLVFLFVPLYWWLCWSDNKRRDEAQGESQVMDNFVAGADVTDKEDRSFRYTT